MSLLPPDCYSKKLPSIAFLNNDWVPRLIQKLNDYSWWSYSDLCKDFTSKNTSPPLLNGVHPELILSRDNQLEAKFPSGGSRNLLAQELSFLPQEVKKEICESDSDTYNWVIVSKNCLTQGKQLESLEYSLSSQARRWSRNLEKNLLGLLHRYGYLITRSEIELRDEIQIRSLQYPESQKYILMGEKIANYLSNVCGSKEQYMTLPIILLDKYYGDLDYSWHTAVLTKDQIRFNYKVDVYHQVTLGKRKRYLDYLVAFKHAVDIDPRSTECKNINHFNRFVIE